MKKTIKIKEKLNDVIIELVDSSKKYVTADLLLRNNHIEVSGCIEIKRSIYDCLELLREHHVDVWVKINIKLVDDVYRITSVKLV